MLLSVGLAAGFAQKYCTFKVYNMCLVCDNTMCVNDFRIMSFV